MSLSNQRFILWDFDGTLAYREGMWSQCVANVVNRHCPFLGATWRDFSPFLQCGFPWHEPDLPHLHIQNAESWWQELYPVIENAILCTFDIPKQLTCDMAKEVKIEYLTFSAWNVYADVLGSLSSLEAQGWRHIVLSNHVPELESLIEALELRSYFTSVFTSAILGYEKPHPEAFLKVLRSLPVEARVVMVGDSYAADIVGAERVGIRAVLVRKQHPDAKHHALSLDDLSIVLKEMNL